MPVTLSIMIVILVVSLWGFFDPKIPLNLMLHPFSVVRLKQFYRFFSADLVHNDPVHLLINEAVIYFACGSLEIYLRHHFRNGGQIFISIYLVSTFTGSLMIICRYFKDFDYSSSGASGSAIGCLFSYMVLRPHVVAFYLPVIGGIVNIYTALLFLFGFIIYQYRTKNPMLNNELHLYSAIGGLLYTVLIFHNQLL